ncbi:transposase [Stutzerimonas stutzeri]|uniref:transposase n=1 Tax=Stutzerimonas stutzeri TaxID=316 RepID=UPI00210E7C47|nr:transposase [Stutzerimonas stutzeri]MCQ4323219.1 transposase [Stutzerimonas stutzeri]
MLSLYPTREVKLGGVHAIGATIYFGDEASIRSDYHSDTTWVPIGETPVIRNTGSRFSLNMISAISPRGELRFKTIEATMNTDAFIGFLKALVKDAETPVFLILDNHPVAVMFAYFISDW